MNRTERLAVLFILAGCESSAAGTGASSGAGTGAGPGTGGSGSSAETSTAATSGGGGDATASSTAASSTSSAATSGTGGNGSGGGSGGGAEGPTPAECFELHTEEECLAAGCDQFLFHPDALSLVEGVCQADSEVGYCFRQDKNGGSHVRQAYFRDFPADGPTVLGFSQQQLFLGWSKCLEADAAAHPECCCYHAENWPDEYCVGIDPLPFE